MVGAWALFADTESIKDVNGSTYNLIFGVLYLFLSAFIWRGSALGLAAAVALYAIDLGWAFYTFKRAAAPIPVTMLMRAGLLLFLLMMANVVWQATPRGNAVEKL